MPKKIKDFAESYAEEAGIQKTTINKNERQHAHATDSEDFRIRVDENNFRTHPDENRRLIKRSLIENGAGRSIVVDNSGMSIGGSGVLEQAESLGLKKRIVETDGSELVVVVRKDISPDDPRRKKLALADNATTDQSKWDIDALQEAFSDDELKSWDVEIPVVDDDMPTTDEDGEDAGEDKKYIVEIQCKNEQEQREVYERLNLEGLECRLLTL